MSMFSSGRRRELCRPVSGEYIVERWMGGEPGSSGLEMELEARVKAPTDRTTPSINGRQTTVA